MVAQIREPHPRLCARGRITHTNPNQYYCPAPVFHLFGLAASDDGAILQYLPCLLNAPVVKKPIARRIVDY